MSSHKLWLDPRFSPRLAVLRAALLLALAMPLQWLLSSLGYGLIGLVILLGAVWPYRYRVTLSRRGLEVGWLFLSERVPLATIREARLEPDPRRWLIGSPRPVLRVSRRERREFLIFGETAELRAVAGCLRSLCTS
jgi:hypothetical protein